MTQDFIYDGEYYGEDSPVIKITDRAYRYGDGLFETMLLRNNDIPFFSRHYQRLISSMKELNYPPGLPGQQELKQQALELANKNGCHSLARVRLTVSGGNGLIGELSGNIHYSLECKEWKKPGGLIRIGLYTRSRKSIDDFSHIKSASYLPYLLSARFAHENGWDEAVIMNSEGRICESSISNIFILYQKKLITPSLEEGCVKGIMRQHVIEKLAANLGMPVEEGKLEPGMLEKAEEIILTNALQGCRPVSYYENRELNTSIGNKMAALPLNNPV